MPGDRPTETGRRARVAHYYLERVLEQDGTLRWEWDRVVPLAQGPGIVTFAATGTRG